MHGIGFGFGMAVVMDPPTAQVMMNAGTYYWGGAFSTAFYIDPVDQVRSELP
jgi:CubicO group peptidase (beta-lactamase class C family)